MWSKPCQLVKVKLNYPSFYPFLRNDFVNISWERTKSVTLGKITLFHVKETFDNKEIVLKSGRNGQWYNRKILSLIIKASIDDRQEISSEKKLSQQFECFENIYEICKFFKLADTWGGSHNLYVQESINKDWADILPERINSTWIKNIEWCFLPEGSL